METKVTVKAEEDCHELTKRLIRFNPDSMICAHDVNTDACQGDSGGPLFIEKSPNHYVIVGTVSFGDGCAGPFPGIYGKIANQVTLDWIRNVIEKSEAAVCSESSRSLKRSFLS
jgi:secreted trypsin-like serine protease